MNAFNISEGISTFTAKRMDHANMQGTLEKLRSLIQQSRLSEYRVAQMMGVSGQRLEKLVEPSKPASRREPNRE
jgi:hypothetical protein